MKFRSDVKLGVLGGGQLGRMMIQEATDLDIHVKVLDPDPNAPCKNIASEFTNGKLTDFETVYSFGKSCDVITIEIENVNVDALDKLEKEGKRVYPQPAVIRMIQDKGSQKEFYNKNGIPTSEYVTLDDLNGLSSGQAFFPSVQKMRTGGYDGRGVQILKSNADIHKGFDQPSILEKLVDIEKEISVIVARGEDGNVSCYPAVELEYNPEANLVEFLFAPASLSEQQSDLARDIAIKVAQATEIVGLLAVEMFVTKNGQILVNEIAPRPHNSGHQTIEANLTSQYGQYLRAILGLPLGSTKEIKPSVMVNLLGEEGHSGPVVYQGIEEILGMEGVYIHLYGKKETRPFRKMGHITIIADTLNEAKEKAFKVKKTLKVVTHAG